MKKLLALALVAMMAGGALAQDHVLGDNGGAIGMFFSNVEFTDAQTNADPSGQFSAYVVLLDCPVSSVGGYELGMTMTGGTVFALAVTGPNGWTNFGDNLNHLVGYTSPLAVETNGTAVLATMDLLYSGPAQVDIQFGPSDPSSWGANGVDWIGPAIADGAFPDILLTMFLPGGVSNAWGTVATLYGGGIVATEAASWTDVKSLFD